MRKWVSHPTLHIMPQPDGSELIRMARPKDWDHAEWCAEPGCENLNSHGARVRCASVYGWQQAGTSTMIGWRPACSHKHALSIWQRELAVPECSEHPSHSDSDCSACVAAADANRTGEV